MARTTDLELVAEEPLFRSSSELQQRHPGEGRDPIPQNSENYFLAGTLISGGFVSAPGNAFGAAGFSSSGSDLASITGCPLK